MHSNLSPSAKDWRAAALILPCGGVARYDKSAPHSFRCEKCQCEIGGQATFPEACGKELDKYIAWKKLGGLGWDYEKGCPEKAVDNKSNP